MDSNSIHKTLLPEADETFNKINTIMNSQGLPKEQLIHLIHNEIFKNSYIGLKIQKHFKGDGDFIDEIVGYDGTKYTVTEKYSSIQKRKS
jgi:hypothetical protein